MPSSRKERTKFSDSQMKQKVKAILDRYEHDRGWLVSILQDVQSEYNYLPSEVLVAVSQGLDIPLTRVYSVATFFRAFSLKPRGRHLINVCLGTACHVRGGAKIFEQMKNVLAVDNGETTPDLRYTLETVACLGCCGLSPVIMINNDTYGSLTPDQLAGIAEKYE